MRPPRFLVPALCFAGAFVHSAPAEILLRWNQAGYTPERPKALVALSDTDLRGRVWRIERANVPAPVAGLGATTDSAAPAAIVLRGEFGARLCPAGPHTPFPFNHTADFSALTAPGAYHFVVEGAAPAMLTIDPAPYAALRTLPLRHLRMMRSGSDDVAPRKFSHRGDARALVHVPDGDPTNGKWKPAVPARTVDALGGWYDAGDQIKFTLNVAYTSYHLLLAFQLHEDSAHRTACATAATDQTALLAEARHGLEFLLRTHPDRDTFIVQVGDARDHDQPERLPEHDALDGKRPALCALSRVHLASASAALSLGARVARDHGTADEAQRYEAKARELFARALEPDTIATVFERDQTNDFYHDPSDADQLALAAAELYALTGDGAFRERAQRFAPPAGDEVGWAQWNWLANAALAPRDAAARGRLQTEVARYAQHAATRGAPWGLPGRYVWGSLARWTGAANAAGFSSRFVVPSAEGDALFRDVLDYVFGRNNWGVSFLFSERLPNTVRHLYGPAYRLLGVFPEGAFSEGPGDRKTHLGFQPYFKTPADEPFHRFNTAEGVFFDRADDFMCQEATIGGQADLVLLLTLASLPPAAARPPSASAPQK